MGDITDTFYVLTLILVKVQEPVISLQTFISALFELSTAKALVCRIHLHKVIQTIPVMHLLI